MSVDEHTIDVAGAPVCYRQSPARGLAVIYLHGVPTSSDDWTAFLELTGGVAPDLIGFGRSAKGGHLDYSIEGLADAVEPLLAERVSLVGHDWGAAVALELAARRPERAERLVLLNPLPLVDGFRWAGPARMWRRPLLGELAMGATTKWLLGRTLRRGSVRADAWPPGRVDAVWRQFDQGTQRAILRLHRRTDPQRFEAERQRLGAVAAPALVLWGEQDAWCPVALSDRFAGCLPNARVERVAGAGHWPWLDQPQVARQVADFLR